MSGISLMKYFIWKKYLFIYISLGYRMQCLAKDNEQWLKSLQFVVHEFSFYSTFTVKWIGTASQAIQVSLCSLNQSIRSSFKQNETFSSFVIVRNETGACVEDCGTCEWNSNAYDRVYTWSHDLVTAPNQNCDQILAMCLNSVLAHVSANMQISL